ncbi:hypothetical protein BB560_000632 [Smittium megazygosporum]|uniref:tRNA (guanine-N(7)-)-methyltransferase n=1 Tax=Smittium megazygosporum TaxID=133381 RepID=A0A2T9ZJU1_9FUNG|nr:hypothetical protein BB560_001518 [Smittium megazygosporum]PVV04854.1 hypothetical protein BB560_000632 [Smittium megazygosporum]
MDEQVKLPRKRFFRQRAHVNILNDMPLEYPIRPSAKDWSELYPMYFKPEAKSRGVPEQDDLSVSDANKDDQKPGSQPESRKIEFADIGCGYGGLLVALAPLFPDTLMLGMEIRTKLVDYLQQRIEALRSIQHKLHQNDTGDAPDVEKRIKTEDLDSADQLKNSVDSTEQDDAESDPEYAKIQDNGETNFPVPGSYDNIAVIRMNAMKYLPNFFEKGQLTKMFFLFPDPHFKKRKHKARIISSTLLAEYAYIMKVGGILYTVTDVKDLHDWMRSHLDVFPLFERIPDSEFEGDLVVSAVCNSTEEGRKVARNNGDKYLACYRRIEDPYSSQ